MTFSSAVRHGTSRGDWNTNAISGQASRGARPSTVMRPLLMSSRPPIIRNDVDFPQPDGPRMQTNSPR